MLSKIKKILNGWEPVDLFYDYYYYSGTRRVATKLGHWFENMPRIISILKIFYYIPACVVFIIFNVIWFIIESFLTKKYRESL